MVTGIGAPFSSFWVWALNCLQNSMMFRPRWPSAGPIGGDGLAAPAGTCNLIRPMTSFAITFSLLLRHPRESGDPEARPRVKRLKRSLSLALDSRFRGNDIQILRKV